MNKSTAAYNVIAAYSDMTDAGESLRRLRAAGVRGENVSLLGREGQEVASSDEGKTDDREAITDAAVGTVAGAAGGGVLGGIAGFLVGLATLAVPGFGPVLTAGVWGATALGALGGGSAGSLIGAISGAALSNDKDETYSTHLERGHVLVGVCTDDAGEFDHAFEAIARSHPLGVDQYGDGLRARA